VPFAIKPKIKVELERLTDIGVLMPVDEPIDWVSNLVIALLLPHLSLPGKVRQVTL